MHDFPEYCLPMAETVADHHDENEEDFLGGSPSHSRQLLRGWLTSIKTIPSSSTTKTKTKTTVANSSFTTTAPPTKTMTNHLFQTVIPHHHRVNQKSIKKHYYIFSTMISILPLLLLLLLRPDVATAAQQQPALRLLPSALLTPSNDRINSGGRSNLYFAPTPAKGATDGDNEKSSVIPKIDPAECPIEPKIECSPVRRALDEKCVKDRDCVTPGVCSDRKCSCPPNYLRKDYYCVAAPQYGQPCPNGDCLNPYVCSIDGYCDCPKNMKRTFYGCALECGNDEVSDKGRCIKRAKLGQRCISSIQCGTAYAECHKETARCSCVPGTVEFEDKECLPTYKCPNGQEPLRDADSPFLLECRASTCPIKGSKSDTCPENSYCVFPSYQNTQGFCCPSEPWCPAGDPLKGAKCKNPESEDERCPAKTHHCYTGEKGTHCCPLPCPSIIGSPAVIVNGTCYAKKALKDQCSQTLQCPHGAICAQPDEQKLLPAVCLCPTGTRRHFGSQGAVCRPVCSSSQVLVGDDCLGVAAPLQDCKHSAQCIGGTQCREGKCQCPCGQHMYYGRCIAQPSCFIYGSYTGAKTPLRDVNGDYLECSPGPGAAEGDSGCPDDAYCRAASLYAGGVCCPFPSAVELYAGKLTGESRQILRLKQQAQRRKLRKL